MKRVGKYLLVSESLDKVGFMIELERDDEDNFFWDDDMNNLFLMISFVVLVKVNDMLELILLKINDNMLLVFKFMSFV